MIVEKFFTSFKSHQALFKLLLLPFIFTNAFLFFGYSDRKGKILYPKLSVKSEILRWNRKIINTNGKYSYLNIFSLNNTENKFIKQPIYKMYNSNITSDVIFFMNTSKNYSTLDIHFDVNNLALIDVICTYCTLQQFIVNKSLHYVNFVKLPIEIKNITNDENFLINMCFDIILSSHEWHCPLYFDTMRKMDIKSHKEIVEINSNVIIKPFNGDLDCKKLINGDKIYIDKVKKKRIVYKDNEIPMNCESIYKRGFNKNKILSKIEKKYSLAFASNIYKNYEVVELKLLSTYSPNNHYCYMVDSKNLKLYYQMIQLANCLPNVYVPKIQYDMKSSGENTSISHYECMKRLVKTNFDYVFLLQNDEMPLKTNRELIEILETINFAMDLRITIDKPIINGRVDFKKSWKFKDLNIFLDGDVRRMNLSLMNQSIEFTNGLVSTGLPRDSVDYLVNKLNITTFINQLNTNLYGNDELTWQTLMSSEVLNVPGYIPRMYISKYFLRPYYLSRMVYWAGEPCLTGTFYHAICSWGVESIKDLLNAKHYFLYRFREDFDYGALKCYGEYLYNKTHFEEYETPDLWFYYNSPLSIFKRLSLTNNMDLIKNYKLL